MLSGIEIFNFFVSDHLKHLDGVWMGFILLKHPIVRINFVCETGKMHSFQTFVIQQNNRRQKRDERLLN